MMYLVEQLTRADGHTESMAGILPGKIRMDTRLRALGYCRVRFLRDCLLGRKGSCVAGHVFHWSYYDAVTDAVDPAAFAFALHRGTDIECDGLVRNNVLASYVHIHFASKLSCPRHFLDAASRHREGREPAAMVQGKEGKAS
jgi:cobyrinic acid a,c-diamide synthase